MNATQYIKFMDMVCDNNEPCKHGHFSCSDVHGGLCCDEEYANLSPRDREIVNEE